MVSAPGNSGAPGNRQAAFLDFAGFFDWSALASGRVNSMPSGSHAFAAALAFGSRKSASRLMASAAFFFALLL